MVPFKAVYDYVKRAAGGLSYESFTLSRSTISNYIRGKRSGGKARIETPHGDALYLIFKDICDHLKIKSKNYKAVALDMISVLKKDICTHYIDYKKHEDRIRAEIVPEDEEPFSEFIEGSGFYFFISEYLSLWDNERYRQGLPPENVIREHQEIVDENDDTKDFMLQRLTDTQSGDTVLTLDRRNRVCDFSCFEKYPLMLVYGPGGQGKSHFLASVKYLHGRTENPFDAVITVPLVNLTVSEVTSKTSSKNLLGEYIAAQYPGVTLTDPGKRYLILLDGVNEYITSKNRRAVEVVTGCLSRMFKKIAAGKTPWLSVVVTTREIDSVLDIFDISPGFRILALSGTTEEELSKLEASCAEKDIPFTTTQLAALSEIPLFAVMLRELIKTDRLSEIGDKYHLLDKVYRVRAEQRLSVDGIAGEYNRGYYLYFYYVILPFFAYRIVVTKNTDSTYFFSNHDIDALLRSLQKDGLDRILFGSFLKKYAYIDTELPDIDPLKLERYLVNEEDHIVKWDGKGYRFEHEEWRDYLVAKYLITCVGLLHEKYNVESAQWIKTLDIDFNVGTNVAELILQSVKMFSDPEENDAAAAEYFHVQGPIYRYLEGAIRLLHTAFCFNEYLNVRLTMGENDECETLHRIFAPLTEYLAENTDDDEYICGDGLLSRCVCEILSKEAEFSRRRKDYEELDRIIGLAKRFDSDSDIILQQEAKLYLCYFQSLLYHEENITVPESLRGLSAEELYEKGYRLLEKLVDRGFYLSANTLGILQTTPAPVLVYHLTDFGIDPLAAFGGYMNVIYGAGYVRRDVAYTVRQALALLVKFVRISDDSGFNPDNPRSKPENLRYERCSCFSQSFNHKTVDFAQKLAHKAEGQEMPYLNYLRGCVALMTGDVRKAGVFFEKPFGNESTLPYLIRRKYNCGAEGLDQEIDAGYTRVVRDMTEQGYGALDRTHPVYTYLEARETELALTDSDEKREERRAFFRKLEDEHGVRELTDRIFGILTR